MPEQKIETPKDPQPKRARMVWRETPAEGLGKPETIREVVTGTSFDQIRENFWNDPPFAKSKVRKVEITELRWL